MIDITIVIIADINTIGSVLNNLKKHICNEILLSNSTVLIVDCFYLNKMRAPKSYSNIQKTVESKNHLV